MSMAIFVRGELAYQRNDVQTAFTCYLDAIKECLKHERVDKPFSLPRGVPMPRDHPEEALAAYWINFVGFFKDRNIGITEDTHPDAYKFLKSFSVNSSTPRKQFKTPKQKFLLKMLQIQASFCIGLLAWDKKDRATAAKRYQEALELAATEPSINNGPTPDAKHLVFRMQQDVQEIKQNYEILKFNDEENARLAAVAAAGGGGDDLGTHKRKDVLEVPNVRIIDGKPVQEWDSMIATHRCATCSNREAKGLLKCSRCKKVYYCNGECQKKDWPTHKKNCVAPS